MFPVEYPPTSIRFLFECIYLVFLHHILNMEEKLFDGYGRFSVLPTSFANFISERSSIEEIRTRLRRLVLTSRPF